MGPTSLNWILRVIIHAMSQKIVMLRPWSVNSLNGGSNDSFDFSWKKKQGIYHDKS